MNAQNKLTADDIAIIARTEAHATVRPLDATDYELLARRVGLDTACARGLLRDAKGMR